MRSIEKRRHLNELSLLCKAEANGARFDMHIAQVRRDQASSVRERAVAGRDVAQAYWQEQLGAPRPVPELVRLSAAWLLQQERKLTEDDLNLAIAASQLNRARSEYVLATAREAAVRKVRSDNQRDSQNSLIEQQEALQADRILWSWRG